MYTFASRIRYSESDPDGYLKIESLIDYFQDCSTLQSDDLGVGMEYLIGHHYAWMVNYWQIDIHRLPRWSERIVTGTSPYELRGIMGFRNFMMETAEGERLVDANSVWTLMDMEKMTPTRIPQEILDKYELFPKFDMEYTPRKIRVPAGDGTTLEPVHISEQYIDSNHHVNNGQYVRMAMADETGEDSIRRLCVEYKRQAHLGDTITPVRYGDPDGDHIIAMKADDGGNYATVRIVR